MSTTAMEQVPATKTDQGGQDGPLRLVNRLDQSRSPYVRGHMKNPVAWQIWDKQTLGLARKHNRILFVSIGYAACHWCHVMERESFESPDVADLLNNHFVPVKIDREERPDIDAIYMNYVQATTGSGGWPLNIFLTPELEPVFGGTYWPGPKNLGAAAGTAVSGTVGFLDVLEKMRKVWSEQEARCRNEAKEITRQLREFSQEGVHGRGDQPSDKTDGEALDIELLEEAYVHFERKFDKYNGGFSSAPKFPTPVNLRFLLRLGQWSETVRDVVGEEDCANAQDMAITTLRKMARGGIRDQIGHGFARYSVTKDWSLPHFEKMLYDQAQLLDVYLDGFLITHDIEMLGAVYDIITYVTKPPIAAPQGGFYSAEDADSLPTKTDTEKREGAYYVWTSKELQNILGPRDGDIASRFYGARPDGNVAHHHDPHDELINQNVLQIATTPAQLAKDLSLPEATITKSLKASRQKLREYREASRPRPSLDDKVVVCWNGLVISALARVASSLRTADPETSTSCLKAATAAASFVRRELFTEDKVLYRVYSGGARGDTPGLCEDYAFLIAGLIDLYEATFDDSHLAFADELQRVQLERFRDPSQPSGFYTTPSPHPADLLLRLKTGMDSAEPSSNNVSARNLYRLGSMLNDDTYVRAAKNTVAAFEAEIQQFPFCFAGFMESVVLGRLGTQGIVIFGGGSVAATNVTSSAQTTGDKPKPLDEPIQLSSNSAHDQQSRSDEILKKIRERVTPDRTIVLVDSKRGQWLRQRNSLLKDINLDNQKAGTMMLCESGSCREGGLELL